MNRDEMKKIIMAMTVYYPNFKPSCDLGIMVDLWTDAFSDVPYENAFMALKTYVKTDTSGFAPSIGALNNIIANLEELAKGTTLNEMEAWALVSKALKNSTYNAEKEFNALPDIVQKAVGSPNNLHSWATSDSNSETVIMSGFIKTYRTMVAREKEINRMPVEVKQKIGMFANKNPYLIEKGDYE